VIGLTLSLIVIGALIAVLFWMTMPAEDKTRIMSPNFGPN
jgi:hypothetical protein